MAFLTIQKEVDVSESPEFQRLMKENQILASETARHVVNNSEIQELRTELEQTKEANEKFKEDCYKQMQEYAYSGVNQQTWTFENRKVKREPIE
jgi:hypothetical protein